MARYFIDVRYDGLAFHGSQVQGEIPTVQLAINNALSTLLRSEVSTVGASRTDEGVHALCNIYQFDTEQELTNNFVYKLNAILPKSIAVNHLYKTLKADAHARFDATERQYRYKIYYNKDPFQFERALYHPYKLDTTLLHKTAEILATCTDFETFSKRNTQSYTFKCDLFVVKWEEYAGGLHFVVRGNRFLRGMVRGLVGTQLQVAKGKMNIVEFKAAIEAKDCTYADFSVAGHGLYLEEIKYPDGLLQEVA